MNEHQTVACGFLETCRDTTVVLELVHKLLLNLRGCLRLRRM
jgi:hypothetical protein